MLRFSRVIPVLILFFPLTLNSTDIYVSSHGAVKIRANINPHIVSWDPKLGSTVLVVTAPSEKEDLRIVTPCKHRESVLHEETKEDETKVSVIQLAFPSACDTRQISIRDRENIFTDTVFSLPMESFSQLENGLINTDSDRLLGIMREPSVPLPEKGSSIKTRLEYLRAVYTNLDIALMGDTARDILHDRDNGKYISPVAGYHLPTKDNIIPGAGRPYRKDTTDGIHHGWDIMAPFGTPVRALSKGKIIRIVNDWSWAKFDTLKKWTLSKDDELLNLDIFRGNQIWLQGMDGNVTFYSHLSKISPDITVGTHVDKGAYLGNIGTSGVPEKDYQNVHLHFEIQQNPFREDMRHPTHLDIMRWDYVGDHLRVPQVQEKTREIFE